MTYLTGNIPVGTYDRARLSNIGIGHGALDGGAGYTYFNEQTGYEFSAVAGLTYNFINPSTQYQNGVDVHLDWGASRYVTKQLQIGLVGYLYNSSIKDAANVWVRVDRLGADGAVAGTYRRRVVGDVLSGGRSLFDVPVGEAGATYQVSVETVDWVKECR